MIIELRGNWTLKFINFADLLQKPSVNLTLIKLKINKLNIIKINNIKRGKNNNWIN